MIIARPVTDLGGGLAAAPGAPVTPSSPSSAAHESLARLRAQLEGVLVGKPHQVRLTLTALLARGHLLVEDVPGVGKTTLAQGLARSLGCTFQRIQFTSDLLPSDILGINVWSTQAGTFEFKPGPLFAHIVLADEINRTNPKTQSCLLEAMNEAQVTLDHQTYPLPRPFMVIATQNPLEYHGTHPLPESQMDRFLMRIHIGYPAAEAERQIVTGEAGGIVPDLPVVLAAGEVCRLQETVERVRVDPALVEYLLGIVQATRTSDAFALGASPRAARALFRAAQAAALLAGRAYCVPDDVKGLAVPVLAHRLLPSARGEAAGGPEPALTALL
ncbi:MAG: MoxR family ATPase, partial [candidate division NC10 bacterium]|nr:MoxR family ATPase [candidate division NC10 bacterium]